MVREAILLKENKILRTLLWLRHGCSFVSLYGDDGECQCNQCVIDFKRDSAEKIKDRFEQIGRIAFEKDSESAHSITEKRGGK